MIENDSSITVATLLECVDEWVTTLKQKSVIPILDKVSYGPFVDDPSFFPKCSSNCDSDFVVMPMRPAAFSLMLQQSMASTDANRSISPNREHPFFITD